MGNVPPITGVYRRAAGAEHDVGVRIIRLDRRRLRPAVWR
jgi:hypothetical protein